MSLTGYSGVQFASLAPHGFNPCFCGCRSLASLAGRPSHGPVLVSILVFVDVAHWRRRYRRGDDDELSFNPCFCGCRSLARCVMRRGAVVDRFQSLFLWMSLTGITGRAGKIVWQDRVSILVFVDVAHWPSVVSCAVLSCGCFVPRHFRSSTQRLCRLPPSAKWFDLSGQLSHNGREVQ
jgi:hypothetical protein